MASWKITNLWRDFPIKTIIWLVVWNMNFIFHFIYGMSSFPLTNSYFSRWLLHHQPDHISQSLLLSGPPGCCWISAANGCALKRRVVGFQPPGINRQKLWENGRNMVMNLWNLCIFFGFRPRESTVLNVLASSFCRSLKIEGIFL